MRFDNFISGGSARLAEAREKEERTNAMTYKQIYIRCILGVLSLEASSGA
jgi:hypothetical protein